MNNCLIKSYFSKEAIQIAHRHMKMLNITIREMQIKTIMRGFPDVSVVKSPPANAGHTGSIPDPGISHMPRSN